jgi:multisubunit Na+/H+ antiporter MnhB subunit
VGRRSYHLCVSLQSRRECDRSIIEDIRNTAELRTLFPLPSDPSIRPWGMVVLIGIGAIVLTLIGRSEDIITAGITTAVVMVVAGISPQHAWKQPILRLIDTVVGIAVGVGGAWIGLTLTGRSPSHARREAS